METTDKPVPMCAAPAVSIDELQAGRELDALVAEKVMGCRMTANRNVLEADGRITPVKAYSFDIALAWLILTSFQWPRQLTRLQRTDTGNWRCDIELHGGDGPTVSAYHVDAPVAICRAALKAVGR